MSPSESIERFLATGEVDLSFPGFEGSLSQRRERGAAILDGIVRRVVRWRMKGAPLPPAAPPQDPAVEIGIRLGPVVRGLLPELPAKRFLTVLPERVEVVTPSRFMAGIPHATLEVRWTLANMLLDDMGAPPLSDLAPQLDGFCQGGRAWVTASTFVATTWSDPLVHECVHLLHTPGVLCHSAPPVLAVAPDRQELLAYGCELWSCLLRRDGDLRDNVARFSDERPVSDPSVQHGELVSLFEAAASRPERAWQLIAEAASA